MPRRNAGGITTNSATVTGQKAVAEGLITATGQNLPDGSSLSGGIHASSQIQ